MDPFAHYLQVFYSKGEINLIGYTCKQCVYIHINYSKIATHEM